MESRVPSLERPWRTATLIAGGVAAIELVLLVVAGVALFARPLSHQVRAAAVQRAHEPPPVRRPARAAPRRPSLARGETSIVVLNGNGITGAAASTAARVRQRGYLIAEVGDAARTDYATSLIMYRPGFRAEGVRLARDLRIRLVRPLDGLRVKDLMGAHVVVIVGH